MKCLHIDVNPNLNLSKTVTALVQTSFPQRVDLTDLMVFPLRPHCAASSCQASEVSLTHSSAAVSLYLTIVHLDSHKVRQNQEDMIVKALEKSAI